MDDFDLDLSELDFSAFAPVAATAEPPAKRKKTSKSSTKTSKPVFEMDTAFDLPEFDSLTMENTVSRPEPDAKMEMAFDVPDFDSLPVESTESRPKPKPKAKPDAKMDMTFDVPDFDSLPVESTEPPVTTPGKQKKSPKARPKPKPKADDKMIDFDFLEKSKPEPALPRAPIKMRETPRRALSPPLAAIADVSEASDVMSMNEGYTIVNALVARNKKESAQQLSQAGGAAMVVDVVREAGSRMAVHANRHAQIPNRLISEAQQLTDAERALGVEQVTPRPVLMSMGQGFLDAALMLAPPDTLAPHLTLKNEQRLTHVLQVQARRHEERMMRTRIENEPAPACCRGQQCRGLRLRCPGGGAILIAFWPEDMWREYEEKPVKFKFPNHPQPCILCLRYDVYTHYAILRASNMAFRRQIMLCSKYVNSVNVDGEYRAEDCIGILPDVFEGLLGHVVMYRTNVFERVEDTRHNLTRFRQLLPYPNNKEPAKPIEDKRFESFWEALCPGWPSLSENCSRFASPTTPHNAESSRHPNPALV